jgi:hypothetical protein
MSEMVDRVARAIEDAEAGGNYHYSEVARVAMEAMQRPGFLLEDGETSVSRDEASEILGRIIDAALKI